MRFSFKSQQKLPSNTYAEIFGKGGRFHTAHFTFYYQQDPLQPNQLGLAIAKKKVNKAVTRNRCKRIAREYFRLHQHQLQHQQIIVMAKSSAATTQHQEWIPCFEKFWQHLLKA